MAEVSHYGRTLAALDRAECRHILTLMGDTGLDGPQIMGALARLIGRGLAARREAACYVLTESGEALLRSGGSILPGRRRRGVARAPALTLSRRVWAALRIRIRASTAEIVQLAARKPSETQGIRQYLWRLTQTGYLRHLGKDGYSARYQLIRDTGPESPKFRQDGSAFDPNNNAVYARAAR